MGVIVTRNVSTGSAGVSGAYTQDEKSNIEFKMEFKAAFLLYYKELTKNAQKQLTNVGIWTDNLKTLKLFNKDLTYNVEKQLVQTALTRISDGLFLNSVFAYNAQKQLVSVTRSGTVCSSSSSSTSSSSSSSSSSLSSSSSSLSSSSSSLSSSSSSSSTSSSSSSSSTSSSSSSSSTSSSSSSSSTSSSSSSSSTSSSSSSSSISSSSISSSSSSSSISSSSSSSSTSSSSSSSSTSSSSSSSSTSSSSSSSSTAPVFPYVQDTAISGNNDQGATEHTVLLPDSIDDGDLILVIFGALFDPTVTFPSGGDWFEIFSLDQDNDVHLSIAYKIADGTEGGTSIVATTSIGSATVHATYSISDHNSSVNPPEVSTGASGLGTDADPDSVTASWGADDNMFIAACAFDGFGTITYPTDYDDNQVSPYSGQFGVRVLAATREWSSTDTQDPGVFGIVSLVWWVACTVVVQGGIEGSSSSSSSSTSSSSSSSSTSSSSSSSCEFGVKIEWESHYTGDAVGGDWYDPFALWDSLNSEWDAFDAGGGFYLMVMDQYSFGPAKSWVAGYRPDVFRATVTGAASGGTTLTVKDQFTAELLFVEGYSSGDIENLTFSSPVSGSSDLGEIEVNNFLDQSFSVTNIEWGFYVCSSSSSSSVSSS